MKRFSLLILLLAPPLSGWAAPLTVAVAANVRYAFIDVAAEFKKETGIAVEGVFSSSGKITLQVKSGAPFDVFLSADMAYPEVLYKEGLASGKPEVYAYGALVMWTMRDLDLGKGMSLLADAGVQKIAIANPKVAPYGKAALQAIEKSGIKPVVEPKLVYGESIAQAAQFVDNGAVDIGFVAKSVVIAPALAGKGKWITLPKNSYEPIAQGVVILKHGEDSQHDNAHKFVAFLATPKARAIFSRYGYDLP